jgi:hypothetical protein
MSSPVRIDIEGIIRATEAQRTAYALREQMYGATFRLKPDKSETLKGWLSVCEVTGNPPSTDVWPLGHPCVCRACNRPR